MTRRKLVAALAVLTTAVGVVGPAASASAQPAPTVPLAPIVYTAPYAFCAGLVYQTQIALATGNPILANLLAQAFISLGCGGAAI
jgi:hypothetical protein